MSIPGWPLTYTVDDGGTPHEVRARFAVRGPLGNAYPAGIADLELDLRGLGDPDALRGLGEQILRENPACRRVVLPVPAGDLDAIGFAEDAGFRYVVDVDVAEERGEITELSLLVLEPGWVADAPTAVDDLPL
ncbi:hypothetical protein A5N78_05135 [Prescottella equi]|uniref:Uncharacterized protein n=2 Tax=Rhodococcus hoagii TaxID=43767 RepID=E9T2U2_RHOHA|nr:hypothetical protein [Prescottella equi]EGD23166.1 hypothetical protein HMPREF0724_12983 [Prescottella equi ATCC 33707]ERN44408.1 hypothetical protein H849_17950 [Prescottella equi NBRC 101255 = C 7]MBM4628820.1 hypothetical protein [Prescottella equi]NKS32687.1 hypothetical protein [Prescottella equi]ORL28799.1 hypothetical protein A6I89_00405 [Prescottella equi]